MGLIMKLDRDFRRYAGGRKIRPAVLNALQELGFVDSDGSITAKGNRHLMGKEETRS